MCLLSLSLSLSLSASPGTVAHCNTPYQIYIQKFALGHLGNRSKRSVFFVCLFFCLFVCFYMIQISSNIRLGQPDTLISVMSMHLLSDQQNWSLGKGASSKSSCKVTTTLCLYDNHLSIIDQHTLDRLAHGIIKHIHQFNKLHYRLQVILCKLFH